MNSATPAPARRRGRASKTLESAMAKQTYSISDLAQELDVTTRTIRFYEEQGMLSPQRRGQERIYSPKDRVALKLILRGKRLGLSLAECKTLIELYDPQTGNKKQLNIMLDMIAERRQQLEQQMLDIQQMQLELDTAEERCRVALEESTRPTAPSK
jgi:DNA-binding transcriptional MerR regulator